jgi:hypothetical protein
MRYNWQRAPYPWERYRTQIITFLATLAVVGTGALAARALASLFH